jgi:hypothetical protein
MVKGERMLKMTLEYKAQAIGVEEFSVHVITQAGDNMPVASVNRTVMAECLAPRLSVNTAVFDFGACVIPSNSSMLPPYETTLQLTNEQDRPMLWSLAGPLDDTGGTQEVFWFSQSSGTVGPKCQVDVQVCGRLQGMKLAMLCQMIQRPTIAAWLQVFYQPRASTAYAVTAALSAQVSGEDSLKILDIHLHGSGRRPRLLFNTAHVVLPAVPLGIASHAEFSIINDGYDNVDLRHRLPADSEHLPLQLKFPQGTMIGIAKTSIPVIVCFQACKASSFTAVIEFLDHDGEPHSQFVSCERFCLSVPQGQLLHQLFFTICEPCI